MSNHLPYTDFQYLLPPRTKAKAPFDVTIPVIQQWMKMPDAVAQLKINGQRNVIYISPEDKIELWGRHLEKHRSYTITPELEAKVRALNYPRGKWNVFDSELLHLKTSNVKNTIYLFDVLVWNGEYLIGDTYKERYGLLSQLGDLDVFPLDKPSIDGMIYGAQNLVSAAWAGTWQAIANNSAVEGFVLKRTGAVSRLQQAGRSEINNSGFMCRVRKPSKNAQF